MRWVGETSSLFWPMTGPAGVESLRGSLDESKTSYVAQNSASREPAGGDSLRSSRGLMTLGEANVRTRQSAGFRDVLSLGSGYGSQFMSNTRIVEEKPRLALA